MIPRIIFLSLVLKSKTSFSFTSPTTLTARAMLSTLLPTSSPPFMLATSKVCPPVDKFLSLFLFSLFSLLFSDFNCKFVFVSPLFISTSIWFTCAIPIPNSEIPPLNALLDCCTADATIPIPEIIPSFNSLEKFFIFLCEISSSSIFFLDESPICFNTPFLKSFKVSSVTLFLSFIVDAISRMVFADSTKEFASIWVDFSMLEFVL